MGVARFRTSVDDITPPPDPPPHPPPQGGREKCPRATPQGRIDVIAPWMPKATPPRSVEPLRDGGCCLRIFAQQKSVHVGIGDIGRVQEIEQLARNGVGRFRKRDQPVDCFGKLGGAARAVAHLPGNKARIDRPPAYDARQRRRERSRPRPLRIGYIEHDQIGRSAEQLRCRRETADESGILGALKQVTRRIVARMQEEVSVGNTLRERAGRDAAVSPAPP